MKVASKEPSISSSEMEFSTAEKPAEPATRRLTWTLLLAVVVASLGTWFPLGYNIVAMNGPQTVIVKWIRHVRFERLNSSLNASQLWCRKLQPEFEDDGAFLLGENWELTTLWAIASSIMGLGGLVSTLCCASLVNRFEPKKALFATASVIVLGKRHTEPACRFSETLGGASLKTLTREVRHMKSVIGLALSIPS